MKRLRKMHLIGEWAELIVAMVIVFGAWAIVIALAVGVLS